MMTENKLRIVALAEAFDRLLRTEIGKTKYREVLARNAAEPDAGICHSHDFCDANMMMDGAFRVVLQRGPDIDDDADLTLWTDAWNLWVEQTAPTRGRVQPPPTSLSTPADDASASERDRVRAIKRGGRS